MKFDKMFSRVRHYKNIGVICGLLVMSCAVIAFISNIYPLLNDNYRLAHNISNPRFVLILITREVLAYMLLVFGIALIGRSRVVWWISIVLLVLNFTSNIVSHGMPLHLPLIIITMFILILNFRIFDQQLYLSYGFVFISAFVIFALVYGVFGSYFLRSQFVNLKTLNDAVYFTLVTYSTVGYGDIFPLTAGAKNFVISMIVMGLVMFTSGITLIVYALNNKIRKILFHLNKGKVSMTNHIVFVGYGIFTKILIERYRKSGLEFIVIDSGKNMDTDRQFLQEQDLLLISPYPGNKDTLVRARLEEARIVIVSFEQDSDTIFAIMNVAEFLKEVNPRPRIVARVYYEENISKALAVGADEVVAPHLMAADRIMALSHELVTN